VARIVVLGASGFIGSHLVKALADDSQNKVIAFGRFKGFKTSLENPFGAYSNVHILPGDLLNRDETTAALENAEYIFHLISTTTPATSNNDPFIDIDTNVRGSIELLELCVQQKVKKVIFLSSGGTVYGDIDSDKIGEATLPQPRSPYGIGKLTVEHYLRYFKFTHGLNYVVYRVSNPYGPGQNVLGKQGVIPIFMHKFLEREPITIYGDGSMVRDYLYIDDLINMILKTYESQNKYDEYNIGSGQGVSVNQLANIIKKVVGYDAKRQHAETPATFVHKSVLDISRFVNEFGVRPLIDLDKGLALTWDYVKTVK
jgi:UDP-glucose 4-epimerase